MEMHFLTPLHTTTLKLPDVYVITWQLCNVIFLALCQLEKLLM